MRFPQHSLLWPLFVLAVMAPADAQTTYTETVLHNFQGNPPKGAYPYAGLTGDAAGNIYGTTLQGGPMNFGVVFKMDKTGHYTILYAFTGGADGGAPTAGVILDPSGNLYGTTANGGAGGTGVVYELDTTGHQTVLANLDGNPHAGLLRDSAGNLYGTTIDGGTGHLGSVYRVTAGQVTVLYNFSFGTGGYLPYSGVIADSAGNLYGTTSEGGAADDGVVYKLDTSGHETVLHSFTGEPDGSSPESGVVQDSAGNLYGTTYSGGAAGYGVVYKLDSTGNETVLYSFTGGSDGGSPNAGVVLDSAGNLYGTTTGGGTATGQLGFGVVYRLDQTGHETVLYTFTGLADGSLPESGVIRGPGNHLYGTTWKGGAIGGWGTVYKVDQTGQETVLYSFPGAVDGGCPLAGVTGDSAGDLYGTTFSGGPSNAGVVYKVDATGETPLYSFTGGADGGWPASRLIRDAAGNLFGTTSGGGISNCPSGCGVVFKLDPAGNETVLYSFTGASDGGEPEAGVIADSAGNLYGSTYWGASNGGVVYKLVGGTQETVLFSGGNPTAGVIRDRAGNLYVPVSGLAGGTGAVQKVDATGNVSVLYSFTGGADGSNPTGPMVFDLVGNLYGTTEFGGSAAGYAGDGVVYKLDPTGQESVLYTFTGGADGANPYAGVILDPSGNLYGTTQYGPLSGSAPSYGVVYEVDTTGVETVLHTFTGGADGGYPRAGVIRDAAGNLYGTTCDGGKANSGVVFKLTAQ
jgi:uncharacterized repeat protein (TIGR03803 family)